LRDWAGWIVFCSIADRMEKRFFTGD